MKKEINIQQNIAALRKKHHITQEQLAAAVDVSPQAVSKWETGVCHPDTLTLPVIADYFGVSIDYLFYGYEKPNEEFYRKITHTVSERTNGIEVPFDEAFRISTAAQHGILLGCTKTLSLYKKKEMTAHMGKIPLHLLRPHGLSVSDPDGFCAMVTRKFLDSINGKTMKRAGRIFKALAKDDCLRVTTEILNFNGISLLELKERTKFDEERVKNAINEGKNAGFIEEIPTPHEILGATYVIQRHHFNCLCLILTAIRVIERSLRGATRSVYNEKFSMSCLNDEENSPPENDASADTHR